MSEESAGLPAAWYTRPEMFARERRAIFGGAWQLLGRRGELNQPGAYLAATLGGWSVCAILGDDGALRAFQNVCRHHGLPVLDAGSGICETLRCRYHGWTYDRQGSFVKAPPPVAPADPGNPLHALARIGVSTAAGLIFIRVAGDAQALDAEVALLDPLICAGDVGIDIDANWKLVIEDRLASPGEWGRWSWPTLFVSRLAEGAIVYQAMPRAFRRTRLALHLYAVAPGVAALEGAKHIAQEVKASCEAQQRMLESSGGARPTEPRFTEFHARLRRALAPSASATMATS